jgi:hypothetical protein
VDDSSGLGQWLLTWSLVEKNARLMVRQRKADQKEAPHLNFEPQVLSEGFHTRLRELVRNAEQVAPVVAIATFSQKVRRDQNPQEQLRNANTHLYYMPYLTIDGILRGFDEYNRVIRLVAAETGAVLVDGEASIPGDDQHFNDSIHFKDAGCVLMAKRVSDALLQSKALRALVSQHKEPQISKR